MSRRTLLRSLVFTLFAAALFAEGRLSLTVLDVQLHGLSIVIRTPGGQTWLVDSGLRPTGDKYPARDVIAPFLKAAGVRELAGVIMSHPHGDHVGGLPYILEHFKVNQLLDPGFDGIGGSELEVYRKMRAPYIAAGGKYGVLTQGDKLALDPALDTEVLWPPKGFYRPTPTTPDDSLYNANSLVLRIQHGANVFLLPGDYHGIASLVKSIGPEKLRCTVLVAPHHGINSTPAMAAATKPKIVLVSCLENYSDPPPTPIRRTEEAFATVGSKVLATPRYGNITVLSDGRNIKTISTRKP